MYIFGLYLGLSTTFLSYLYLKVVPLYAQQIQQGQLADERLWWWSVVHAYKQSASISLWRLLSYALLFGLGLWLVVSYKPWCENAPVVNLLLGTIWVGVLALLARIDKQCFLLPDVLTQFLLWVGLLWAVIGQTGSVTTLLVTTAGVYVAGRIINILAGMLIKQPLFGLGDVKLLVALTTWLGPYHVLLLFFLACVLCLISEALQQRCWRPRGHCAFGPYIVSATFLVWLLPYSWVALLRV